MKYLLYKTTTPLYKTGVAFVNRNDIILSLSEMPRLISYMTMTMHLTLANAISAALIIA